MRVDSPYLQKLWRRVTFKVSQVVVDVLERMQVCDSIGNAGSRGMTNEFGCAARNCKGLMTGRMR
jgi:hypothetical protein